MWAVVSVRRPGCHCANTERGEGRMWIGGQATEAVGGGRWTLIDPATEAPIEEVAYGDDRDAVRALDAAASAFPDWSRRTAYQRAAVLEAAADRIVARLDELARRTTEESGKPLAQSRGEWAGAPNYLRVAAEEARRLGGRWIPSRVPSRRIDVTYAPMGVIGVITAWNFPVYNVNRAVSSALAAGCTVVVRPSELTPRSALDYARAFEEAGLPPGVLNVINGDPHGMGQAMLDDPRCRKIAFTGSTRVGKLLMDGASRTVTRLALELGGNAPVLVFPDVDVEAVARAGVVAKTRNGGQVCIAPQRFLVHASIAERFAQAAAAAAEREVVGHGLDPKTTVGPMINARQRDRIADLVDRSVAMGAKVLAGGRVPEGKGFFYPPTVLTDVPHEAPVMREEIFGPVMPIVPFDTTEDALRMANDTEYGLASFVFTRDLATAMTVSEQLEFGMVGVNDWYPVTAEAPFGGVKQSGMGRESGVEGVHEYSEARTRYFSIK
ncbi:MAG: NAD-dependent succinate-semialdehyde dehydrogenase [Alphaproteobacteria bacterium]|nr:NAD-dependent succinate-semialdehyde dehydrogenase [Alphaproteobacteria bacterium]MCB9697218.1 NAD-dependent succinate-semialdehyde dehydrogenase [Alphaproteobacteria bacterium]